MNACKAKTISHSKYIFIISFIVLLLTGCSVKLVDLNQNGSVSHYAEQLFKQQNFLTQQVMMLSLDEISFDEDEIAQTEMQMHDACQMLNEYARREMDGLSISIFFRRKVKASLKGCEEAVLAMEKELNQLQ